MFGKRSFQLFFDFLYQNTPDHSLALRKIGKCWDIHTQCKSTPTPFGSHSSLQFLVTGWLVVSVIIWHTARTSSVIELARNGIDDVAEFLFLLVEVLGGGRFAIL